MDASLALSLNHLATHLQGVLPLLSNLMVYIIFIIGSLWVALQQLGRLRYMVIDFMYSIATPLAGAVLISEGLSKVIDRDRPFVTDKSITLLVPHNADGGFPSHHMTVMVAIAISIWFRNRALGLILLIASLISGIARVGAGIHYPTDILAGFVIGFATTAVVHRLTNEARLRALRS